MAKKKTPKYDEIEELDRVYNSLTRPAKKRSAVPLLSVLTVLLLLLVGGFMVFLFLDKQPEPEPKRLGAVTVAGVDLSGMTLEEATGALEQATCDTYSQMDMVILVDDAEYALTPSQTGVRLDIDGILTDAFAGRGVDTLDYLDLNMQVLEDRLSELDSTYNAAASKTVCLYDGQTRQITVTVGTPQTGLDISALRAQILEAYRTNKFRVRQDCSRQEPESVDLDALFAEYSIPAVDAVMDMQTFEVTAESNGQTFDLEAARTAYYSLGYGESMTIDLVDVLPEVTAQELSSLLYRDVLAEYKTKHTWDDNRTENLRLACKAVNGLILMPGEQFRYNAALGERTTAKGYKPAGAYVNGETVDTVGGGICQVSSTLYYCTLIADLQIDKRQPHSYVSSYMPMGMDATVSWGGPDFWFTNNTRFPLRIEAWVQDGYVHVKLIGTDEKDYYVQMEYELLETVGYDTVYQELPPDNEKGLLDGDVMTTPYTGYKVKTYKLRYSKETGELISRDFEANSNYKKRDKVICKIVDPNAPTDPTEPVEPADPTQPTEPPTEPADPPAEPTDPPAEPADTPTDPTPAE